MSGPDPIQIPTSNPFLTNSPVTSRHTHSSHTPITTTFPQSTYNEDRSIPIDGKAGLFTSALGITLPFDRKGKRRNSELITSIPEEEDVSKSPRRSFWRTLRGLRIGSRKRRASLVLDEDDDYDGLEGRIESIARVIAQRLRPGLKKGNLPFVIIFIACLIIFISALAGIGYIESDPGAIATANFRLGRPVYPGSERENGQQIMAQRREMEQEWAKKKRPKDGAWMKKHRDDGAVRRANSKEEEKPIEGKPKEEKQAQETKVEVVEKEKPAPIDPRILAAADKEAGYEG